MVVEKELRQQHVDSQQSLACQRDAIGRRRCEISVRLQPLPGVSKTIDDVDAELRGEIARTDRAALQLQNDLTDQTLIRTRAVRAPERQTSILDRRRVALPAVEILHVHAVDVAERRDAK